MNNKLNDFINSMQLYTLTLQPIASILAKILKQNDLTKNWLIPWWTAAIHRQMFNCKEDKIMFKRSTIRIACLISCIFVMNFVQAQQKSLTIGLIGDSTVANTYGCGPAFAIEVNDQVKVLNYAKNGATLDSLSKKLDALIKKKPNYIIIQFGHNDMKRYDTKSYSEKLKGYVDRIKRAGIKAIIFSSVTRRNFGEDGKIRLLLPPGSPPDGDGEDGDVCANGVCDIGEAFRAPYGNYWFQEEY